MPLKLKPMEVPPSTPTRPSPSPGDNKGKTSPATTVDKPCKYFASDSGCRAGKSCKWSHSWDSVEDKASRCWICGSKEHLASKTARFVALAKANLVSPLPEHPRLKNFNRNIENFHD